MIRVEGYLLNGDTEVTTVLAVKEVVFLSMESYLLHKKAK